MKNKIVLALVTGIVIASVLTGCGISSSNQLGNKENSITSSDAQNKTSQSFGAKAASEDEKLTVEDMLTYAMQDEYLARREYELIIEKYGQQNPFSNIIKSEEGHISSLTAIL